MRNDSYGSRVATQQFGNYSLSLLRYERDSHIPLHAHTAPFVTVVLDGAYRETTPRETRDCTAHSIVVHEPEERHADTFSHRTTTCLNVHGAAFERSVHLATPAAAAIALKLRDEFRAPDAFSPMVVEALMLELFVAGARQRESSSDAPSWLRAVRATMERRFREPLSLTMLAESVDVSAAHLARAFRLHFGSTIGDALRSLRIDWAKERLASPAPLHEIALDAGFADQSHFTRTFRRATGMTPAAFRRAHSF